MSQRKNIEAVYPLSNLQQGMLFHSLYSPGSGVYVEQLSCALHGRLDVELFGRVWQSLADRHAVLRTAFGWEGLDEPLQVVGRRVKLPVGAEDWRGLGADERAARLEQFLEEDRLRGFELGRAPLMRLSLFRTGDEAYRFVWTFHHILLDGWSLPVLLTEALALYDAWHAGRELRLGPARPFQEYIGWLRRQDARAAERFWRGALEGFTTPTPLRVEGFGAAASDGGAQYGRHELKLSVETTSALQQFARTHKLTLNTVVQGAWALLLSRYSGEEDVLFGATVSGRPPELEGVSRMVGLFINTLPVRARVRRDADPVEWLRAHQSHLSEAQQFEYTSLLQVKGWSEVPSALPLFETLLVFENYPVGEALKGRAGSVEVRDLQMLEQTNYPLTVAVVPGAELSLLAGYDRRRFDHATVERILGHWRSLLEGFAAGPPRSLGELRLSDAAGRVATLREWNAPAVARPSERCVHHLFEEQAARTPGATALVFEQTTLSYEALNRRANQLAHYLRAHGVGPESRVGVCVERGIEMVVALLGVMKAGGAYLPLDPAYPPARLADMIADGGVELLLTGGEVAARLPEHGAPALCLEAIGEEVAAQSDENPRVGVSPENLVYVIYTSGSTGRPRGVMVTHGSLANFSTSMAAIIGLDPSHRFLQFASLSFDASAVQLYPTLLSGAAVVLHRAPTRLANRDLLRFCEEQGVTVIDLPAAFWHQWIDELRLARTPLHPQFQVFMTGGETPSVERLRDLQGMLGRPAKFISSYGPTETTVTTAVYQNSDGLQPYINTPKLPLGYLIPNARLRLLDEHMRPTPVGVPGELYIGGDGLARGYLDHPGLTAHRFVPDPFGADVGGRLYRTGDLARYLPDGNVEFLGRADEQVKVRGYRIELGEIESALARHEQVRAAVVTARDDAGGAGKRLVAYVVPEGEHAPGAAELRVYLRERLPEYMVPSAFVTLEAFPITPNGKVDRKALPEPDLAPTAAYVAPRTPVEELVCGLFSQVLGVERVGVEDNFFELGGHSLLATQLVSRVREAFGVELPLRELFEEPAPSALARAVEAALAGGDTAAMEPITPAARGGELELSFAQQRLWFLDQLEPGSMAYNLPAAVRLSGALDVEALSRALDEVVRRHEALRTSFPSVGGQPVQVVAPPAPVGLPVVDLSTLDDEERGVESRRLLAVWAGEPFDLAAGPLLRVRLVKMEEEAHLLLLTMHHIVSDGWSMQVLVGELTALYSAFSQGRPSPLPELPVQYADYAAWQRRLLQGEVLESQLAYWRSHLAGAPPAIELPTDKARPRSLSARGAKENFQIPAELTAALKTLGRREGATLFMTLLAAFQTLLQRFSGQDDIVVGLPVAGRRRLETEALVGLFVNTMALRTDLSGDPSFDVLLRRVREATLGAYANQDVPFERVVEELRPERSLGRAPLYQVLFTFQNERATADAGEGLGLAFTPLGLDSDTSKYELALYAEERGGELFCSLVYSTELFEPATARRLAAQFLTLLEGAAEGPHRALSQLPLSAGDSQAELLADFKGGF
jgi:amino acid adenylation domain-containing protein